jgi:hypothetical protein
MAYFSDLSPYAYGSDRQHRDVVHVGWLDNVHPYSKGKVADHLVKKIKALATNPTELYRGLHICELCPEEITCVPVEKSDPRHNSSRRDREGNQFYCPKECASNGEIRITVRNFFNPDDSKPNPSSSGLLATNSSLLLTKKVTYAAPVMIAHYIEAHGYLPPSEFLKALEDVPE